MSELQSFLQNDTPFSLGPFFTAFVWVSMLLSFYTCVFVVVQEKKKRIGIVERRNRHVLLYTIWDPYRKTNNDPVAGTEPLGWEASKRGAPFSASAGDRKSRPRGGGQGQVHTCRRPCVRQTTSKAFTPFVFNMKRRCWD